VQPSTPTAWGQAREHGGVDDQQTARNRAWWEHIAKVPSSFRRHGPCFFLKIKNCSTSYDIHLRVVPVVG
jgi:hypothetical protein